MSTDPDTVAVITDIHGNLPALQAALARIEELGIEKVFRGVGLVGYGPHPNEVCTLIAERDIPTIYGNYDFAIARDLEDCGCAYVTQHDRELGQRSVDWTLAHTSQDSKDCQLCWAQLKRDLTADAEGFASREGVRRARSRSLRARFWAWEIFQHIKDRHGLKLTTRGLRIRKTGRTAARTARRYSAHR